ESGEVRGPRIYSTGLALLPASPRLPSDAVINLMGWMNPRAPEVADAIEAVQVAKSHLAAGVDGIKLFVSVPPRAALAQTIMEAPFSSARISALLIPTRVKNTS